jgi:hypothetical protein
MFKNTNGQHSLHLVRWAALVLGVMLVLGYASSFLHKHAPRAHVVQPAPAPALAGYGIREVGRVEASVVDGLVEARDAGFKAVADGDAVRFTGATS